MGDSLEIKLKVHDETDLYNPFDPDQKTFSDGVESYIQQKYDEDSHPFDKLIIHIISETPVDEERLHRNFQSYISHELDVLEKEQKITTARQIRLFIIGIIFIAIWLTVSAVTENVTVEVLSIIGSVAVWEAVDIWILDRPGMRAKKRKLQRMKDT